jgi:hypothetical protein
VARGCVPCAGGCCERAGCAVGSMRRAGGGGGGPGGGRRPWHPPPAAAPPPARPPPRPGGCGGSGTPPPLLHQLAPCIAVTRHTRAVTCACRRDNAAADGTPQEPRHGGPQEHQPLRPRQGVCVCVCVLPVGCCQRTAAMSQDWMLHGLSRCVGCCKLPRHHCCGTTQPAC